MIPIATILLPQIPGLIIDLVNLWKKSNPEVTLDEWLLTLSDGDSFEDRKRAAAIRLGVPYTPTEAAKPKTKATARDIVDAALTGVIPEWFSEAEKAAVLKNLA